MKKQLHYAGFLFLSLVLTTVLGLLESESEGLASVVSLENIAGYLLYTPIFFAIVSLLWLADREASRLQLASVLLLFGSGMTGFFAAFAHEPLSRSTTLTLFALSTGAAVAVWLAVRAIGRLATRGA